MGIDSLENSREAQTVMVKRIVNFRLLWGGLLPWGRQIGQPRAPITKVIRPAQEIGDFLRAEASLKCEEALDLAERAEAEMAAYFLECAIPPCQ